MCAHASSSSTLNGSTITVEGLGTVSTNVFSTQSLRVQAPHPQVNCPGGNVGGGICNFLGTPAQITVQNLSIVFAQQGNGTFTSAP